MKLLFLLVVLTIITSAKSDYKMAKESSLYYIYREPKVKQDKPPLIVLLHGLGSNEKDLFSFADELPGNFLVVSARAPYKTGQDSYQWFEVDFSSGKRTINGAQAEKSRTTILEFISQLKQKHKFDVKQVYLCGFSQGAIMAYSVGLTNPDKIKGIAVMSGRLLNEVKLLVQKTEKLKGLAVFISHGKNDEMIDISYARESVAYLKELGINPTYTEYPEGHTISSAMLSDLIVWLNKN